KCSDSSWLSFGPHPALRAVMVLCSRPALGTTCTPTFCRAALTVAVAVLFAALGSGGVLDTVAVFMIAVSAGAPGFRFITKVNVPDRPALNVARVHVIAPVPPAAGVVQANPAGWVSDTNVVLAGTLSTSWKLCASCGPLLLTVSV